MTTCASFVADTGTPVAAVSIAHTVIGAVVALAVSVVEADSVTTAVQHWIVLAQPVTAQIAVPIAAVDELCTSELSIPKFKISPGEFDGRTPFPTGFAREDVGVLTRTT